MDPSERCRKFLSKHRLLASAYDPREILTAFLGEMEKGLSGEESSLAMIPSFIGVPEKAPVDEKIIVLDAGGTNFRTAVVRFDHESLPHIESFASNPMPGVEREIGREAFFNQIADYLAPIIHESNRLGFCFSYPALIDRARDGKLLYWTKEVKAPGVVGEKILANLAAALTKRSLPRPAAMTILNDTVSSLLAGVTATRFSKGYHHIGFILGTGTNTAYIEANANIKKEKGLPPGGSMAINCESANFNKLKRGDIDLALDSSTASPGKYILEKMISGGYIGSLCTLVLQTAVSEGVVPQAAVQDLLGRGPLSTPRLSAVLSEQDAGTLQEEDPIRMILSGVVERAALLTAINMSAPVIKLARSGPSGKKYCISADGSVYFKLPGFRERAEHNLNTLLKPYGVEHAIVHVDEAPIIGTAVAGLTEGS